MGCGCNQNKTILPKVPIRGDPNTNKTNRDAVKLLRDSVPDLSDTLASKPKASNQSESKQTDVNKPEQLKRRRRVFRRHQRVMRRRRGWY